MSRRPDESPDAHENAYYAAIETSLRKANVSIEASFDSIRHAIMTLLEEMVEEAKQHSTTVFVPRPTPRPSVTTRTPTLSSRVRPDDTCH